MRSSTRLFIALALMCCVGVSIVSAATRPEHYGIALPFPKKAVSSSPQDSLPSGQPEPFQELRLEIDTKGVVRHVASNALVSSDWLRRLERWLAHIPFEPGKRNGKKVPMLVPARLFVSTIDSTVELILPVDNTAHVADYNLFAAALGTNGAVPPEIDSFPWYHADVSPSDTFRVLRYVLAKVALDRSGSPSSITLASTNYPAFAEQLLSAINWAKYRAVKTAREVAGDEVFILITFIPTSHFPTQPWTLATRDSLDLIDRQAIRLLLDTVGTYMMPPLPKGRTEGLFLIGLPRNVDQRGLVLRFTVDTAGVASPDVDSACESETCQFARALARQMAFYPALDYQGRPRSYIGRVIVYPVDASNVRVWFSWLLPD